MGKVPVVRIKCIHLSKREERKEEIKEGQNVRQKRWINVIEKVKYKK